MRYASSFAAFVMSAAVINAPVFAQGGPNAASTEPVTIASGSSSLSGIFEAPSANGQHGGVLIVAGDVASTAAAKQLAKALAARGVVAMTYEASSATESDAAAAAAMLKLRGDVQAGNVGVIGIGAGSAIAASVAKAQDARYVVAVASAADAAKLGKPTAFAKLSRRVLVVQGSTDAFSGKTERARVKVEERARNVTMWTAPDDDVSAMSSKESALAGRIASWAAARAE